MVSSCEVAVAVGTCHAKVIWCIRVGNQLDLVELRRTMMEGLRHTAHHYMEARAVADLVPEETLRKTPDAVAAAYPADWRALLGV